jgi:cobalt-zinc-cadmium efflux system outer membrane protein
MHRVLLLGLALGLATAHPSAAQEPLTLEAAAARARERSAAVRAAEAEAEQARLRLAHLPFLRDNPVAEGAVGRREPGPNDLEIGVTQPLEIGGGRGARRAEAEAALAHAQAAVLDARRMAARSAATTYLRALHAEERLRLARASAGFAADLQRIAERRLEAGDVAALDVNLAGSAHARARAESKAAEAERESALGELRVLLDMPAAEPLLLADPLEAEAGPAPVAELLAVARERADLQALRAQLRLAEAEVRAGRAAAWPELAPGVRYERDEGTDVVWAGLSVTLPVFDRGRAQRAAGESRAGLVRARIAALERAIENEVRTAHRAYELRREAWAEMSGALATADDNEALARRSYEVGQIGLGELLAVRRETLEARRAWLEALLAAGTARFDLEQAGAMR